MKSGRAAGWLALKPDVSFHRLRAAVGKKPLQVRPHGFVLGVGRERMSRQNEIGVRGSTHVNCLLALVQGSRTTPLEQRIGGGGPSRQAELRERVSMRLRCGRALPVPEQRGQNGLPHQKNEEAEREYRCREDYGTRREHYGSRVVRHNSAALFVNVHAKNHRRGGEQQPPQPPIVQRNVESEARNVGAPVANVYRDHFRALPMTSGSTETDD